MLRSQSTLQADILKFSQGYHAEHGDTPTHRQIATYFDIHKDTAEAHVRDLCQIGQWPLMAARQRQRTVRR